MSYGREGYSTNYSGESSYPLYQKAAKRRSKFRNSKPNWSSLVKKGETPKLKAVTKKPISMPKVNRDRGSPPGDSVTEDQYKKMTPKQKRALAQANNDWYYTKV